MPKTLGLRTSCRYDSEFKANTVCLLVQPAYLFGLLSLPLSHLRFH